MTKLRFGVLSLVFAGLIAVAAPALATPIGSLGAPVAPDALPASFFTDYDLVASMTKTLSPAGTVVTSYVWEELATGDLAFGWYAEAPGPQLLSLSLTSFPDFVVGSPSDIYNYDGPAVADTPVYTPGGAPSVFATWDGTSGTIGLAYAPATPKTQLEVFIPKNPVKLYTIGKVSSNNSGSQAGNTEDSFQPVVPEPGTLVLAFLAVPFLGAFALRRRG